MAIKLRIMILTLMVVSTATAAEAPDKTLIDDGSMVHDVGSMHLNITNFGLIGSMPGAPTPMAGAPSARWPGVIGVNHLFSGGLMIGAIVNGMPHVSTGQYEMELRASDDVLDVIYEADAATVGGQRYPSLDADDDGDGLEDEDALNGVDDDGDGLVDEDFARVSDQYLRCVLRDDDPAASSIYPDHSPIGLDIIQESFQWAEEAVGGGVGFRYTVRNDGVHTPENIHFGFFMDADIGDAPGDPANDMGFSFAGLVDLDGESIDVQLVGMKDSVGTGGLIAVLILDHPTDPVGVDAPASVSPHAVRIISGQSSYDNGGDPTNDAERYDMLSSFRWDPDTIPDQANDFRAVLSTGRFASLAPGQEITFDLAMIVGADMNDLLRLAAEMIVTQRGQAFDRDGEPTNGEEFVVHWLRDGDVPVANEDSDEDDLQTLPGIVLSVSPNPFNPTTKLTLNLDRPSSVSLRVHDLAGRVVARLISGNRSAGTHHVEWNGTSIDGRALSSGRYLAVLETDTGRMVRPLSLIR